MPPPTFLRETSGGTLLSVKLQPRASRNEIGEPLGNELKIKVTAPPVDSAANEALVAFLAETLHCARSRVELIRGHTSRHKTIMLHGFKPDQVMTNI
jgi:uncharacterized protein